MADAVRYQELLNAMLYYCDYRDRCSNEVMLKINGLTEDEAIKKKVIQTLKELNVYSDERYTEAFVSGKLRIKKWGRNKIKSALYLKKIPKNLIVKALNKLIDEEQYQEVAESLFLRKWKSLNGKNNYSTKQKLYRYLYSKGYESELINSILKKHLST